MATLLTFIGLLLIGLIAGSLNERNHFRRLAADEAQLSHILVTNLKHIPHTIEPGGVLVSGNVVIAVDYFKRIMAALRMIFGGELRAYQTLMTRARREAIVRMKREADALGATAVHNVRIEFSSIGSQPSKIGGTELLAYGTAVKAS